MRKFQFWNFYHCWREHVLLRSRSSFSTPRKLLLLPFTRDLRTSWPKLDVRLWWIGSWMDWVARESLAESILASIDLFEIFELLCRINDPVDLPFVKVEPDLALVFLNETLTLCDLQRPSMTPIDTYYDEFTKWDPWTKWKWFTGFELYNIVPYCSKKELLSIQKIIHFNFLTVYNVRLTVRFKSFRT